MHEYYPVDLSKKVKSAKRVKMLRGEYIPAKALYGYYKSDAGIWEPEEPAASVIRQIYQMTREGMPASRIKDELFKAGYPTPKEYSDIKSGKEFIPTCLWKPDMVSKILANEEYTGTYIAGKMTQSRVDPRPSFFNDRSEWIIIPNVHTPIIDKETFDETRVIIESHLKGNRIVKPWGENAEMGESQSKYKNVESRARAIYGYTHLGYGKLTVDETTAPVVREIFNLALQGLAVGEIAKTLTDRGYATPSELSRKKVYKKARPCCWETCCVRDILKDERYTGATIFGKFIVDSETGRQYKTDKSDWVVTHDVNPPIVSREVFDEVQRALYAGTKHARKNLKAKNYLLRGKAVCSCCGTMLIYDLPAEPVFRCYRTDANPDAECHKMAVKADPIDEAVMEIICKQAEIVLNAPDLSNLKAIGSDRKPRAEYEKQIEKCVERRQQCYEKLILREIDKETYKTEKDACTAEIERLKSIIEALNKAEQDGKLTASRKAIAKTALNKTVTNRELVETLIDKVRVYPDNRIIIEWKISDFCEV